MKKLLFILLLLFPMITFAQWEHIYTTGKDIFALDVVSPDTVYAVGNHCAIRTLDGGENWEDINYNCEGIFFRDVIFPTLQIGYLVTSYGAVLKTTNYGNDWQEIFRDNLAGLQKAEFINPDTGWIIGDYTPGYIVIRTYDGGDTWNYYFPNVFDINDIQMPSSNIGYITHLEGLLKTNNGGNSWFSIRNDILNCCYFFNSNIGYVVGSGGIYKTLNGGEDWILLSEEIGDLYGKNQLQFINQDTGYYIGYDAMPDYGMLATTTNGGYDWNYLYGNYFDIEMYNNKIGYCLKATDNTMEIYKTTNGGIIVGISELENNTHNIVVYPNPFNNKLFISTNKILLSNNKKIKFEIIDINGKEIFYKNIYNSISKIENLSSLKPGIYFYSILSDDLILKTGKIIKVNL